MSDSVARKSKSGKAVGGRGRRSPQFHARKGRKPAPSRGGFRK